VLSSWTIKPITGTNFSTSQFPMVLKFITYIHFLCTMSFRWPPPSSMHRCTPVKKLPSAAYWINLKATAYVKIPSRRDTPAEKHVTKILKCFTTSAAPCIILPPTPGSPQWYLSLRFPHQNSIHPFLLYRSALHAPPISFFSILSPAQLHIQLQTGYEVLI
jgi:hypothetical protein